MQLEHRVAIELGGYSPRYQEIDQFEAWYWGLQYEVGGPFQRQHKWTTEFHGGKYIPLAERAPYDFGIPKALVNQSTAFLFDEGRFPQLLVEGDDTGAVASEGWLRAIAEHVGLRAKMLQAARIGGRCRSVFVYFKIVMGEPILDVHSGKVCEPLFDLDGKTLKRVRKRYKTGGEALVRMGYVGIDPAKLYWYQHDFLPEGEIKYFPVEFLPGPVVPQFEVDEARSMRHNLGFVPGQWMVNLMRQEDSYDGIGTYEGEQVLDMIHLCNESLSQATRATRNACDPQWVLETQPDAAGNYPENPGIKNLTKGGVWEVAGKLGLIESAGSGQKMALEQFDRVRKLIADTTGWPEVEAAGISDKAQSAEALRILFQGAISFAALLRVSYGNDGLVPLCRVILRVLKATAADSLNLDGFGWDGEPVDRADIPDRPRVTLEWGEWFAPTAGDRQMMIAAASAAVGSGLLSQETAVSFIAKLYGRDGSEELEKVLTERQARVDEVMREQQALQGALGNVGGDDPPED